ncbi:MAG: hypothetical protein AAF565_11460 [Pseudomonadota bacterium]
MTFKLRLAAAAILALGASLPAAADQVAGAAAAGCDACHAAGQPVTQATGTSLSTTGAEWALATTASKVGSEPERPASRSDADALAGYLRSTNNR